MTIKFRYFIAGLLMYIYGRYMPDSIFESYWYNLLLGIFVGTILWLIFLKLISDKQKVNYTFNNVSVQEFEGLSRSQMKAELIINYFRQGFATHQDYVDFGLEDLM